jgi:tRNA modification GTPase
MNYFREKIKTIVALVTAPVNQNIAIIRLSGPLSYEIIGKICKKGSNKKRLKDNRITLDKVVKDGVVIDQVLLFCFYKPSSFTGEDTVEISCHGNLVIVNRILELVLENGAVLASPGEFSKQSFFNGKVNLIQANAINDLIRAPNLSTVKLAIQNFDSRKQEELIKLENSLLDVIAKIEINIDYPEYEDVENVTPNKLKEVSANILKEIMKIREKGERFAIYEKGIKIGIFGKPNVGKSTLLNSILNEEKAIVSPIPGTTRDIVEGKYMLNGIPLTLFDTAGIRNTNDEIEKKGIIKSRELFSKLDLCFLVLDNSKEWEIEDEKSFELLKGRKCLVIINKEDLQSKLKIPDFIQKEKIVKISAEDKKIENLEIKIKEMFLTGMDNNDSQYPFLSHSWQQSRLKMIEEKLSEIIKALEKNIPVDVIAGDLQISFRLLRELSGNDYDEDLLEMMFNKFCIGK